MINTELLQAEIEQINNFFKTKIQIEPLPSVALHPDKVSEDDFLIRTGDYDARENTVNLYTDGRHIKDILRSYAHELIHHAQHLKNPSMFEEMDKSGNLDQNYELRKLEGDAYLNGNLLFRMWTETQKPNK